jgi:hypothetical protein
MMRSEPASEQASAALAACSWLLFLQEVRSLYPVGSRIEIANWILTAAELQSHCGCDSAALGLQMLPSIG